MNRPAFCGWWGRIFIGAGLILTAGCVTVLNPELLLPQPLAPAVHRSERTLNVAPVTSEGPVKTAVMDLTEQFVIGNEQFQVALVRALDASGMFRSVVSAGSGDYELQARIVSRQSQRAGFLTASSTLIVNYRLREAGSDRHVWYETIITEDRGEGTSFTEGVPGAAKKSLAGAARRNIEEMLQRLSERIR